jgi:hypothetical protein
VRQRRQDIDCEHDNTSAPGDVRRRRMLQRTIHRALRRSAERPCGLAGQPFRPLETGPPPA